MHYSFPHVELEISTDVGVFNIKANAFIPALEIKTVTIIAEAYPKLDNGYNMEIFATLDGDCLFGYVTPERYVWNRNPILKFQGATNQKIWHVAKTEKGKGKKVAGSDAMLEKSLTAFWASFQRKFIDGEGLWQHDFYRSLMMIERERLLNRSSMIEAQIDYLNEAEIL